MWGPKSANIYDLILTEYKADVEHDVHITYNPNKSTLT